MATKPNPLDQLARAKVTKATREQIERAAAERGLTTSDVIRQAIDQHLAKGTGAGIDPATADAVAGAVAVEVTRVVGAATRRLEPLASALVKVAERLDQIEAAQGRRAA
ncbi:MAG TPA: ribbon-helix-helix protein, CopG family [Solirubrobacterales bacterium]|nr:ribbon-helix-helix protein, CopG family [Solirubrobacterales bacterium]